MSYIFFLCGFPSHGHVCRTFCSTSLKRAWCTPLLAGTCSRGTSLTPQCDPPEGGLGGGGCFAVLAFLGPVSLFSTHQATNDTFFAGVLIPAKNFHGVVSQEADGQSGSVSLRCNISVPRASTFAKTVPFSCSQGLLQEADEPIWQILIRVQNQGLWDQGVYYPHFVIRIPFL